MGKSFVFKDRTGAAVGYLTQGMDDLRCRVKGARENMHLILLDESGIIAEYEIANDGREQAWKAETATVFGAVIASGEGVWADTGSGMKMRYEEMKRKTENAKDSPGKAALLPETEEEVKAHVTADGETMRVSLPERRWPPPPCWHEAIYRDGRWTEEQT